ncbi:MAG: DUF6259 domain-containing protein [Bacteroidota bacterium]
MKNYVVLVILIYGIFSFQGLNAQETINLAEGFILENEHVRYEFEPVGMGLSGMIDLETGYNHIQNVKGKHLLWEVTFGKGTQRPGISNNYKPCSYGRIEKLPNGGQLAILEWNDLRFWEQDSIVSIQVMIELQEDNSIAEWRIFVQNLSDYWGLWEVACPSVNGFPRAGVYDVAMPVTGSGGHLIKKWDRSLKNRSPSGFFPMQFMSLNNGSNGVYFSSMDGESRAKDFYVDSQKEQLSLIRYPENMNMAGSDMPDYYAVAFGPYQGGWLEAAQRYRCWALDQVWTSKGTISKRADFPEAATNIGLWIRDSWVWDKPPEQRERTPDKWMKESRDPHEMNKIFLEVMKKLDVPIALHWYNWHHVLFDNEYPHYLPALPGFKERVKELIDAGAIIVPYINGLSADSKISDWDKFDPHAIKDESGGLHQHFYWDGAGRLTPMCPNQVYWHDEITSLVDSIINCYGVNGIYIDEVSCNSHELCFNKNHRHTMGGGRYWADGWRDFYRKVLNVAHRNGRDIVITSESANEIFYDLVTANLFTGRPTDYEIPMLQVVYSGYTLFYGSSCDFKKSDRFFNFWVGQGFINGVQIGWMNFDLFKEPQYKKKVDFFKQCGKYRMVTQKFHTFGRLLRPVYPENKIPVFEEEFRGGGTHTGTVPSVEARLWQAEDGHLAVFIVNYVNSKISFSYSIDLSRYGLKADRYQLTEITPEKEIPLTVEENIIISRTENMKPNKVMVIEIEPLD